MVYQKAVLFWLRRAVLCPFWLVILVATMRLTASAGSVTLAWDPSSVGSIAGYNIYYGGASGAYTNMIPVGNATNVVISGLIEGATYYFAATTVNSIGLESGFSPEVSMMVPLPIVNQPPTLNAIGNVAVNENAGTQTVNLSGIGAGAGNQASALTVTRCRAIPD